ncbi:SDR family NAD(P)-dependent oxidoreductase [Altericroceibacterium endophyticum]|uniref:Glucose 1-dehydrogenase n=1 Tax=Altericroceibacterium endophyticum TaxID=1808508 RepID=A0A6I4T169_9SPHN|nr:SDR family oxidoreductase [Altericroceibacterium endophyticum]MXO64934.1 glucose 1-dehydrogenase [Altericroceibacterium endophyticum]
MHRFANKTVIVTGSSSGIGEGIARRFADEGANVVLNSRSREDCEKVAADLDPECTLIVEGDVSERGFAKTIIAKTVERFGALDILCSNAGIAQSGAFSETEDDDIDQVLSVNVKGMLYMCRDAYPELKKTKGCIVATSSVSGTGGDYNQALYTVSKGAVTQMVRSLALEWGECGIRVNAVNPTFTRSDLTKGIEEKPQLMKAFNRRRALKRPAEPADIAGAVTFLASDDADYITGINMPVDGGISASNGQPDFRKYD